jgi:hypothetical protein
MIGPIPAGVATAAELAHPERSEAGAVVTVGAGILDLDEDRLG